jgi:multiple sugar transport system permease protein
MPAVLNRPRRTGWLLLGGLVTFLTLLLGFPLVANIVYSFSEVRFSALHAPRWLGIANYTATFSDPVFWSAAAFSLRFGLVATFAEIVAGFVLVLILDPLIVRHRWLTAPLLLPMMISPALLAVMYRLMLNDAIGIIPQYLESLGFTGNLLDANWAFLTVVGIEILQWTPFAFLSLLTAYQALPAEIYEAARIDSAGPVSAFCFITCPLMFPALLITAFLRFIDSFRVFDHIYVLTGGGPGVTTTSMSIYIYKMFFQQERIGPAVATSMILLVASIVVVRFLMPLMILRGAR